MSDWNLGLDPTPATGTDPYEATNRINFHDHSDIGKGEPINSAYVTNTPAGNITATNTQAAINQLDGKVSSLNQSITDLNRSTTSKRQTVTRGVASAETGQSIFLSQLSGFEAQIYASAIFPFACTIANGSNSLGEVNYNLYSESVLGNWVLPANKAFLDLYIEYNPETEEISYGSTELPTVYSPIAPSGPATDQHWFDLNSFIMKRWNGTAWENKIRLMVGEAVTGASEITSIQSYNLNGCFRSLVTAATSATVTQSHFLGMTPVSIKCYGLTSSTGTLYEYQANRIGNIGRKQYSVYTSNANLVSGSAATYFQVFVDRGF